MVDPSFSTELELELEDLKHAVHNLRTAVAEAYYYAPPGDAASEVRSDPGIQERKAALVRLAADLIERCEGWAVALRQETDWSFDLAQFMTFEHYVPPGPRMLERAETALAGARTSAGLLGGLP